MNHAHPHTEPTVIFVDMNSFFASCEQQVNYWLRGRPVAVCVYTGKSGCVIAPSVEAKERGVRLGMRLDEAMRICPDLVPVETTPARYRHFHLKIMDVLRGYSPDVIPRSIDEAVVDLTRHRLMYKDTVAVARQIKVSIKKEAGDWLRCSIGVAPNAFLAKLASNLQKPDGLTVITPDTIDDILSRLTLTDLPGIASRMALRLQQGGIMTPLQLRYASPEKLRLVFKSLVGLQWHYRLNFGGEMDLREQIGYKSMQAMRTLSATQRASFESLDAIFMGLCLKLEGRMVKQQVYCRAVAFTARYYDLSYQYETQVRFSTPVQDGIELYQVLTQRMVEFARRQACEPVLNGRMRRIEVGVNDFIPAEMIQYHLFDGQQRRDKLRKVLYEIKGEFGKDKIVRAAELRSEPLVRDVIGFGSIRDMEE